MRLIIKARKMPVGTISHGRKKVAEGKWVPVKKGRKKKTTRKKALVVKGKEPWRGDKPIRSKVFPNVATAEFNMKPGWHGATMAKKFVWESEQKLGKHMSDPKKRALIRATLPTESEEWQTFAIQLSGKDVSLVAHTARYLSRQSPLELLTYVEDRGGMLKTDLLRLLEYAAYKKNKKKYIDSAARGYGMYGLTGQPARDRATKYGESLKDKYHKDYMKIWGKK